MSATLVIQSHREPLPFDWLRICLDSVESWARQRHFDYRFVGDELFDLVEADLLHKTRGQIVIATDLARLRLLQRQLAQGYDRVVWCDADFLIFDPGAFVLPQDDFAFGREVWVQKDERGRLRVYPKPHNACMMFRRGNGCLDFYADAAARLLRLNRGGMPPQFIGPKLLGALHNVARFPLIESAGMLSPLVERDILAGGGAALALFLQESRLAPTGVNLSASLTEAEGFGDGEMQSLIDILMTTGLG